MDKFLSKSETVPDIQRLHNILRDPILMDNCVFRSIVSSYIRFTPEPEGLEESEEIALETFYSEFRSSQVVFSEHQVLNYLPLIYGRNDPTRPISPPWASLAKQIAVNFTYALRRMKDIYPNIQRKKNISRLSAVEYCHRYPHRDIESVTTADLEIHYGRTGEMILGPMEMRYGWKFNDVKPRFYYAQGGHGYHNSKHIKRIAVALMESIESTKMYRRRDPSLYLRMPWDHFITTHDFKAFTTSLSELKFFLYWMIQAIKEVGETELYLVDYHRGRYTMLPSELLDSYNEQINIQGQFTLFRVIDRLCLDLDGTIVYAQQNSGMLGVAGNIGFSTALHGFAICTVCHRDKCVCVGDDALGATKHDPYDEYIPVMMSIGNIHPSKFDIRPPESDEGIRFLKRGFFRYKDGLFQNFLLNLVSLPYVDGWDRGRTVLPNFWQPGLRLKKIIAQIGSILWEVQRHSNYYFFSENEASFLNGHLEAVYKFVGLPAKSGCYPGYKIQTGAFSGQVVPYVVPALDIDYYTQDWLEVMLDRSPRDIAFTIASRTDPIEVFTPSVGERFRWHSNRGLKMLEDMGIAEIKEVKVRIFPTSITNCRVIRNHIKGEDRRPKLCDVEIVKEIPAEYLFLFSVPEVKPYRDVAHMF